MDEQGYLLLDAVYTAAETEVIASAITAADASGSAFRTSEAVFAIRRLLQEIPGMAALLFTPRLKKILSDYGPPKAFVSKSIYFDKPGRSNWFVAYHQDLTVSLLEKPDMEPGWGPASAKDGYYAVQPPAGLLEQNLTIRIHLDDTDESNGALRVIPGAHRQGITRRPAVPVAQEVTCCVKKGGLMLMRPLLWHASSHSTGDRGRRVIHLEFSNAILPGGLRWAERTPL